MRLDFFGYGRGRGDERLGFERDRRDEKDVYDVMTIIYIRANDDDHHTENKNAASGV